MRDEVVTDYGVAGSRVAVIYNGVDLARFHPDARTSLGLRERRALGIRAGMRVCVAIGTGFERKGVDLLLRLWREMPRRWSWPPA